MGVYLAEVRVGTLIEVAEGRATFHPDPGWVGLERRPVLGQRFEDAPTKVWEPRKRALPTWFENLLPERGSALRELIAADSGIDSTDDLGLLARIGGDLPGAVVVRPDDEPPPDLAAAPDERTKHLIGAKPGLKFSLAGMQLKFSMVQRRQRYTLPAGGEEGRWIVKMAREAHPHFVAQNEFSMMSWAREAGFTVPEVRLIDPTSIDGLPDNGPWQAALAVHRYDRTESGRVHQEDFAQILGAAPDKKYDDTTDRLGKVVLGVLGADGFDELTRRLVFVAASGNADAHLKNWSVVYPDGVTPRWSPMYDQVATIAWPSFDQRIALKLAGVRQMNQLRVEDFRRLADLVKADPDRAATIVEETLSALRSAWVRINATLPLTTEHRSALTTHWSTTPLLAPLLARGSGLTND